MPSYLLYILFVGATACWGEATKPRQEPASIRVFTKELEGTFSGELCPVGPWLALTAGHVVDAAFAMAWVGPLDEQYELKVIKVDPGQDVAFVQTTTRPFPFHHKLASVPARTGDWVTFWGIGDIGRGWYMYRAYVMGWTTIKEFEKPVLILSEYGHAGVSGGCIFNEDQDVVGIMMGARAAVNYDPNSVYFRPVGLGISVVEAK